MTLSITNGNALGGTYVGATAWKSFHVNCYGKVFVSDSVVSFSEPTRGMFVESGAQFQVTPGAVFEINNPSTDLTLSGLTFTSCAAWGGSGGKGNSGLFRRFCPDLRFELVCYYS